MRVPSRVSLLPVPVVKGHILLLSVLGGVLIAVLRYIEYRALVVSHSVEIYIGLVALLFAAAGIWLGVTLTGRPDRVVVREVAVEVPGPPQTVFVADPARRAASGLTPREFEILELVAAGLSNREIAERIFVSENTVKTHCSRLFEKLGARRRTQAVQAGKDLGLIP